MRPCLSSAMLDTLDWFGNESIFPVRSEYLNKGLQPPHQRFSFESRKTVLTMRSKSGLRSGLFSEKINSPVSGSYRQGFSFRLNQSRPSLSSTMCPMLLIFRAFCGNTGLKLPSERLKICSPFELEFIQIRPLLSSNIPSE